MFGFRFVFIGLFQLIEALGHLEDFFGLTFGPTYQGSINLKYYVLFRSTSQTNANDVNTAIETLQQTAPLVGIGIDPEPSLTFTHPRGNPSYILLIRHIYKHDNVSSDRPSPVWPCLHKKHMVKIYESFIYQPVHMNYF